MNGNYSIITNFGCHYKCPYCIVKKAGLSIPKTDMNLTFETVRFLVKQGKMKSLSFSGGGDPLWQLDEERIKWYHDITTFVKEHGIKTSLHTGLCAAELMQNKKPSAFDTISYHMNKYGYMDYQGEKVLVWRYGGEKVRVVFVVTKSYTEQTIQNIVSNFKKYPLVDELSFRQMVNPDYTADHTCEEYLKAGHGKDWYYIQQGDYNSYIVNDKINNRFENFKEKKNEN